MDLYILHVCVVFTWICLTCLTIVLYFRLCDILSKCEFILLVSKVGATQSLSLEEHTIPQYFNPFDLSLTYAHMTYFLLFYFFCSTFNQFNYLSILLMFSNGNFQHKYYDSLSIKWSYQYVHKTYDMLVSELKSL